MRKTLLLFALIFSAFLSQAQITLETTYPVGISIVKLQYSGYKYASIDTQRITLYNMNHSVFRQITIPLYTDYGDIRYLTETLFDTDTSNIEYMVTQPTSSSDYTIRIYEEDGTLLFSKDSTNLMPGVIGDTYALFGHNPIVNTDNGTKMLLGSHGLTGLTKPTEVYNLPGSLECSPCSNPLMSGMSSISGDGGFLSAAPNPANTSARINYRLPDDARRGTIAIYDIQGNELKRYEVDKTFNSLDLPVNELSSGTYFYSLKVEGKNASAKKMIVVH